MTSHPSSVVIDHLSIKFRVYHNSAPSLKEQFASIFKKRKGSSYSDFLAVNDCSLTINAGDRLGIIGSNGAGKSTLLKAICRIYEPSSGTITVNGRIAPLLEIGAGFHPEFTGRENIYLNGAILGFSKAHLREIESDVIAFAELEEFIDMPVKYYSSGMYLRLAFSLATAMHPDILVLDELFAGGDAAFVEKATARMYQLIDRASIMIMVSHQESLVRDLCNRVIWVDHGKVIADGAPDEIMDRYLSRSR
jgi:ABC-type polysaccharide/polyol phosphate transport system ATPase subunit